MVERDRGGAIVNVTSVDGSIPALGVGYDVSKAGANAFTRSLAVDLSPYGIRVNAVAPGVVPVPTLERILIGELPAIFPEDGAKSGLNHAIFKKRPAVLPLGRMGTPEDIANAVLYLCSDTSSYVTGQILHVDGGWTLL